MSPLVSLELGWALWPTAPVRGAGMPFDWVEGLAGDSEAALRALLVEPTFLAALTWQNPGAVRTWAGHPAPTLTSYRAAVLARYVQRYCAKNETIGFFGPGGWAELDDAPGDEPTVAGTGGVRRAEVCFELWALLAVARRWESDERVRRHLPVRLNPCVYDDVQWLHRPYRAAVAVDAAAREILDRVDGARTVDEVAGADPTTFNRLVREGVLRAGFRLAPSAHPEESLRGQLAAMPDPALRGELLAELDGLERALAEVAKVAEEPVALAGALARLDERFTALTGDQASRTRQEATAGRTLSYVDCRRDLDVRIPAGLVNRLAAPLSLLLHSARWLTAQVAEAAQEHLGRTFAALSARRSEVTLGELYLASADLLAGASGTVIHDVVADFQLRWAEVLGGAGGDAPEHRTTAPAEVRLASADVAPLVAALFAADAPGWAAARQHSPDLLLSVTDDGLRWVLGELHVAMNTLESRVFCTLADDPSRLVRLTAADLGGGRVVPRYPYGPQIDSRSYPPPAMHVPDRYLYWSHSDDMGAPDGQRSWPATALVVRPEAGELVAGPRDARWCLPVREFFGELLSALVVNRFQLPAPGPGVRVSIDELVVQRARWHFPLDKLPDGLLGQRGYRPEVLAEWLAAAGLPRYVFAKIPGEAKPFLVDLGAPLLVGNLARAWRRAATGPGVRAKTAPQAVELHEMLPSPDQLWLRDARGRRYTTEFRFVAVDPVGRRLPGLADGVVPCPR